MPWSALPKHIDEPHEWNGTDWDNRWQRWLLRYKGWFAFGPRAREWWARWREVPVCLVAFGCPRLVYSNSEKPDHFNYYTTKKIWTPRNSKKWRDEGWYVSIIQYWTRFSFSIQWPLHFHLHWYWPWFKLPAYPNHRDYKIWEMVYLRFGARRDQDKVYWFPSLFIGGDFN